MGTWDPASRRWNKSSDDCVDMLHWLIDRRNYLSASTLYDIFNKRTSLNFSDYYHHNTSATRAHNLTIVPLQSTINSYRFSYFVNTVFLWNNVSIDILNIKSVNSHHRALYRLFCT